MRFPYHGAGIALVMDGKVLLGKRSDHPFCGRWSVPGGGREKCDKNELETAVREFSEETGVDFSSLNAEQFGSWSLKLPFFSWRTFFYIVPAFEASFRPNEFSEIQWVSFDEVRTKKHLRPFTRSEVRCLSELLRKKQA